MTIQEGAKMLGISTPLFREMIYKAHKGQGENRWLADVTLFIERKNKNYYKIVETAFIKHIKKTPTR